MHWSDSLPTGDGIYWVRSGVPHEAFGVGVFSRLEGQGVPPQYIDEPHVYVPGHLYLEPLRRWSEDLNGDGPPEFIGPLTPPRARGFWSQDLPVLGGHYWVRGGSILTVMFVRIAGEFTLDPEPGDALQVFLPGMEEGYPLENFVFRECADSGRAVEFAGPFTPPA